MYLKTPKKYSSSRRKRHLFSRKRLLFYIVVPLLCAGGWWIYQQRDTLAPMVGGRLEEAVYASGDVMSTMNAPTPLPTENPMNVINRADANWMGGRVEDAVDDYGAAVNALPNDVTTHYRYALGLVIDGRYTEALAAAQDAITADPFSADAWAVQALAQARNGDYNSAIASGQHALTLDPNNATAYAFLSEAYLGINQTERALAAAQQAVDLNPDSPEAYYARARTAWLIQFDSATAIRDYAAAYDLAPYRVDAAVNAAELESYYGEGDRAVEMLIEARDANPQNPDLLYMLGDIYDRVVGDPNQAGDVLSSCVEANEDYAPCHYKYGRVLIKLEQIGQSEGYGRAAQMLSDAVRLRAEQGVVDPYYNYWAGEAQIYLGNCAGALIYLQEGYEAAVEQEDAQVASDLQGSIRECGSSQSVAPPAATPDADLAQPTLAPSTVPNA